ncbi:MAG: hypothetical protein JW904_03825 [Spirochaetales bacterium]|nr:hypothetical protein [Spirochaetales bacterium]
MLIEERNYSEIEKRDLLELLEGSVAQVNNYFYSKKGEKWLELYNINNPLCVALCQGAAMHYYDKSNGIKDFDIWIFYPFNQKHLPYRTYWNWFYNNSKFGLHSVYSSEKGRKVDVLVRSVKNYVPNDPVATIYSYFKNEGTITSQLLLQKAVVLLSPEYYFGKVIWYKGVVIS